MFDFMMFLFLIFSASVAGMIFGLYDLIKSISKYVNDSITRMKVLKISLKIIFSKQVWLILNLPDTKKDLVDAIVRELNAEN